MPFKFHKTMTQEDKEKLAQKVANKVQSQDTTSQIRYLASALDKGLVSKMKLREALDKGCRKSMADGKAKMIQEGKTPTVELLLEEYYKDKQYKELTERVGLTEDWFINLAK